jgi:soluble lytic murein transglycosylase
VGAIRLQSQQGDVDGARAELLRLAAQPRLGAATARAALFLAVTELLGGDLGRAGQHLTLAERRRELADEEAAYWRGRLAEARGDATGAVDRYLEVLERRPFHPLAELARRRLAVGALAVAARQRALDFEGRADATSMRRAALLSAGQRLRDAVTDRLERDPRTAYWVQFQPVPVADWPLWTRATGGVGDRLAGLGLLLEAGPETVASRFPPSDPRLCFTAAGLLQASEPGVRAGIALAEELFDELPRQVPADWVAPELRRILYPFPWAGPIRVHATALRVDPALLAAVIREESRFDPRALSPAAARGLAQLTLPTDRRLASDLGLGTLAARDLERPEISIQLGARYLAELARRFPGAEHVQIAAYNAGEDQAALWRRSCLTSDPAEFLAKIGYRETKAYVVRVLESRAQYADLYGRR